MTPKNFVSSNIRSSVVWLMEAGGAVIDDARDWVYAKELSKPAVTEKFGRESSSCMVALIYSA